LGRAARDMSIHIYHIDETLTARPMRRMASNHVPPTRIKPLKFTFEALLEHWGVSRLPREAPNGRVFIHMKDW
jgi:hypothetical protein